jgi:cell division transport system permease protein
MRTSSFGYLVKEGARSLWVNRLMSTAAVGVLAACLILVGAAGLFAANVSSIVSYFEDENEIVVFLEDGIDQKGVDDASLKIRMMDNISEASFVSNEQALQEQMDKYGEYAWLLEEYQGEENMLPHAFRVKVKDLVKLEETAEALLDMSEVQEVRVPTEVAHTLLGIRSIVSWCGFIIVLILLTVSLIIIANTIKITVFNRRKEISIMKYVGATDSFIKLPFVVEGLLLGLLSALLAYMVVWGGYVYVMEWAGTVDSAWLQELYQYFIPFEQVFKEVLISFCAIGVGVGSFGSMVFVGKYLKV